MRTLRLLIKGAGLTQTELASAAGISEKHLRAILSGSSSMSQRTATALGVELKVPPAVLLLAQYLERESWAAESTG